MSSSETIASSISSVSTLLPTLAVLVNGPECQTEETEAGVVSVEPARCRSVDLGESDNSSPIKTSLQLFESMFRGRAACEVPRPEEQELLEHSADRPFFQNVKEQGDIREQYGYKYGFNQDEQETDGNCFQSGGEEGSDAEEDGDDQSETLLNPAAYSSRQSSDSRSNTPSVTSSVLQPSVQPIDGPCIYLLGRSYDPDVEPDAKRDDELSLFWVTYRKDFVPFVPYQISSDAGWGCMLRSGQMMLAQALRVHFKSRNWRSHRLSIAQRRREPFLRSLLTWLADFPSSADNVYSLHNMVAAGMSKYEILPGEWYGPTTTCYVIRDLVYAHEARQVAIWNRKKEMLEKEQQEQDNNNQEKVKPALPDKPVRVFRVYVAAQGTIYKDAVQDLLTKESRSEYDQRKKEAQEEASSKGVPDHPLATAEEDLKAEQKEQQELQQLEWDTALLVLIPLRLGINEVNDDYAKSIAYTFSLPQSVGMLGGRPRAARWFYGAMSDGSKILAMDPHTVQTAPRKRAARVNGKKLSVVDISEEYLRSIHTTNQEAVPLRRMDPSIALGFYCRTREDLQQMQDRMHAFKVANPNLPEIFTIAETTPDYAADNMVSASMMDDLLGEREGSSLLDDDNSEDTDDEYVML